MYTYTLYFVRNIMIINSTEVESPMVGGDPGQPLQFLAKRVCETGEYVEMKDDPSTDLLEAGYYTYIMHLLHNFWLHKLHVHVLL